MTRSTKLQQYLSTATDNDLQWLAGYIDSVTKKKEYLPTGPRLGLLLLRYRPPP